MNSAFVVAGSPLHRSHVSIWCWSELTSCCCPSHDSDLRAHPSPLQCGVSSWYLHLPHPPQHGFSLYSLRGQVGWPCPVRKASYIVVSKEDGHNILLFCLFQGWQSWWDINPMTLLDTQLLSFIMHLTLITLARAFAHVSVLYTTEIFN